MDRLLAGLNNLKTLKINSPFPIRPSTWNQIARTLPRLEELDVREWADWKPCDAELVRRVADALTAAHRLRRLTTGSLCMVAADGSVRAVDEVADAVANMTGLDCLRIGVIAHGGVWCQRSPTARWVHLVFGEGCEYTDVNWDWFRTEAAVAEGLVVDGYLSAEVFPPGRIVPLRTMIPRRLCLDFSTVDEYSDLIRVNGYQGSFQLLAFEFKDVHVKFSLPSWRSSGELLETFSPLGLFSRFGCGNPELKFDVSLLRFSASQPILQSVSIAWLLTMFVETFIPRESRRVILCTPPDGVELLRNALIAVHPCPRFAWDELMRSNVVSIQTIQNTERTRYFAF